MEIDIVKINPILISYLFDVIAPVYVRDRLCHYPLLELKFSAWMREAASMGVLPMVETIGGMK